MAKPQQRALLAAFAAGVFVVGCARSAETPVERLPHPREVLVAVGKRLARSLSAQEITDLAHSQGALIAKLTQGERSALGRGWIRFQIDQPAIIEVAVLEGSVPFWLADQGFRDAGQTVAHPLGTFRLYRKTWQAGWVGLGVNGLDATNGAHYAAFIRPLEKSATTPNVIGLNPDLARSVEAKRGIGPWFDDSEPFRGIPPHLKGARLLQTSNTSRDATVLLKDRAWKTHVPSSPEPDQVAIAYGADPATALTFTWRTDPSRPTSYVRLAPAKLGADEPLDMSAVQIVRGQSELVESDGLVNDPTIRRHRAWAVDLRPDTTYAYSLGDGSATGWAPWRLSRTGPARPRDFSFLYMGDPQCGLEDWGKLLHEAHRRNPASAFLLIAGDLVDRGNERTNWDHFFLRAKGVFDELPLMPAIGNHEYLDVGPRLYRAFFEPPANGPTEIDRGLVYAFEYGDAVFAVLDSNPEAAGPRGAAVQAAWLDRTLSRSRAAWKFVVFHHPMYTSHLTRATPAHLRDAWIPVFDKHRVDLVLQGHDHAYLRTHPMRGDRRAADDEAGTTYVVAVSGTKYCDQAARDYIARGAVNVSTYQTIQIQQDERRLVYRAVDVDGREIDYLVIEKRAGNASSGDAPPSPPADRMATDPRRDVRKK
jgi:acid phosphatase type 7